MAQLMEADVTVVCGPKGKHDPDRIATSHGAERGSVTLGGGRRSEIVTATGTTPHRPRAEPDAMT